MQKNKMVTIKEVQYEKDSASQSVNVTVKPYLNETSEVQDVLLVLFADVENVFDTNTHIEVFKIESHTSLFLEDLKAELTDTRLKLKETYEALDISNDNISSYNEELISSNEEMQSTNEELQSVNEELQTVNNEYQIKIRN